VRNWEEVFMLSGLSVAVNMRTCLCRGIF
jgi:hypothetical protein